MFLGKTIARLPFCVDSDGVLDLWPLVDDRCWRTGCEIGRARADALIEFMRKHDDPTVLLRVSEVIIAKGDFSAVNVGFGSRLSERLLMRK